MAATDGNDRGYLSAQRWRPQKPPSKMTTSPLLPASAVCPTSPSSDEAVAQHCRRCSFLLTGTRGGASLMANSLLPSTEKVATVVNGSKLINDSIHFSNCRRFSLPSFPMMATSPFIRFSPCFAPESCSGQLSREESGLELEALAAVHQFAIAVQNIAVSEMLPRTPDLIFVNLTTLDGQPYCLELTTKGWRVTSLRTDCMHGDFTQMDMFTHYYGSLHDLMETISPGFRERFSDDFGRRFELVENADDGQHVYHHSNSSGPVSDCSEDGDYSAAINTSCVFCQDRLPTENGNSAQGEDEQTLLLNRLERTDLGKNEKQQRGRTLDHGTCS